MNQELVNNNYIHVPSFLTASQSSDLAGSFFGALKNGRMFTDDQVPNSPAAYNLLPCVKILVKKIPQISELSGVDVLPTFTYGRIYVNKDSLKPHIDRFCSEISITVNLQKTVNWPFWIKKPNGESVSIELNPGDGLVYLGCQAEHWREEYQGHLHVQAFFHYVNADGEKAYMYFDKNKAQMS